jgi:hypothetical protein
MKSDGERGSAVEKVRLKRWFVEKEIKIHSRRHALRRQDAKKRILAAHKSWLLKAERPAL